MTTLTGERNCGNCYYWVPYQNYIWGTCNHFEVINEGIDTMSFHSCGRWEEIKEKREY